jgi:hypothetical protein
MCIALFAPVDCNGCIYENGCWAGGAGYSETDCVLLEEPIPVIPYEAVACKSDPDCIPYEEPIPVNPDEALECNESDPDLICFALFAPVNCKGCIYDNGCLAGGAGYSEADCVQLQEPIPVNPVENPKCDQKDPDLVCSTDFEPVVCNGCKFSNGCWAAGAGYSETDCVPYP